MLAACRPALPPGPLSIGVRLLDRATLGQAQAIGQARDRLRVGQLPFATVAGVRLQPVHPQIDRRAYQQRRLLDWRRPEVRPDGGAAMTGPAPALSARGSSGAIGIGAWVAAVEQRGPDRAAPSASPKASLRARCPGRSPQRRIAA
jgi:hypothetical protein